MNIAMAQLLEAELERTEIQAVSVTDDSLIVDLRDGRSIVAPIAWYPRISYATPKEQQHFEIHRNIIHWPDLDEEISVRGLLLGRKSGESSQSLQHWLAQRNTVTTPSEKSQPIGEL